MLIRWGLKRVLPLPVFLLVVFVLNIQLSLRYLYTCPPEDPEIHAHFDYDETELERTCRRGERYNISHLPRNDNGDSSLGNARAIPNIIHFVYALHPSATTLPFIKYLSIRAAILTLQPKHIYLHHSYLDTTSLWASRLPRSLVTFVHHTRKEFHGGERWHIAHTADVLRLAILQKHGGMYMDTDVFALKPFTPLIEGGAGDFIMGHEGGDRYGLCNAIILARNDSSFLRRWTEHYKDFDDSKEWNYHSVVLPKELADKHEDEICALAPTTLFWPLWSPTHLNYMHTELGEEEAERVQRQIDNNGGSLREDQMAYHAWGQMAWEYLDTLTPEVIRTNNTRFNIMVRKFLDYDDDSRFRVEA